MRIGTVINSIWATRKDEALIGVKLLVVQLFEGTGRENGAVIVAADMIGAGIGERVLITEGSSARQSNGLDHSPIDAMIVGIIDDEKKAVAEVCSHA